MIIVLWIVAAALVLTLVPAALLYLLHLFTGEPVPKKHAQTCWRWAVLASLLGIIAVIYERVAQAVFDLF